MGITDYLNGAKMLLRLIPHRWMMFALQRNSILPFYHIVGDHEMPHIKHLYRAKSIDAFKKDLEYYLKYYELVDLEELNTKTSSQPKLHLTFDDGFRECFDIIRPILLEYGVPATFFINSGFIDNKDLMYRCKASFLVDYLKNSHPFPLAFTMLNVDYKLNSLFDLKKLLLNVSYHQKNVLDEIISHFQIPYQQWQAEYQPYMNIGQIKKLASDGFSIGAHSIDHPPFSQITADHQVEQIAQSVDCVNAICCSSTCAFSFPFHDLNVEESTWDYIEKANTIEMTFGVSGIKSSKRSNHFHRIAMEDTDLSAKNRIKSAFVASKIRSFYNSFRS